MWSLSPLNRLYLAVAVIIPPYVLHMSPIQYEIKDIVCEVYAIEHEMGSEGCSIPEVDAAMAATIAALAILQLLTAMSSIFFATLMAKRIGLKRTLAVSVGLSTIANAFYVAAVYLRSEMGLTLIFLAQFTTAIGGMGGASMVVTAMISVLTAHDGSTSGALGFLGGLLTIVMAIFSVVGGFVYDWKREAPFVISTIWIFANTFVTLLLAPDIPMEAKEESKTLDVLRIFGPRTVERKGKQVKDWSLVFAGIGAGLSVIATSYTSTELNIIGMNSFGVTPQEMGTLSAWMSLSKGIFLILLFPRLSKAAFKYLDDRKKTGETQPLLESQDDTAPKKTSADLYMLIASIILELAAVILLAFSTQKWHLFALSTFVPLGSGVGALVPALILHFVPPEKRPEAVGASQLLDASASAAAIFIFGYIFAWLSKLDMGRMVFLANGAVGVLALVALLFVRMD